MTLQRGAFPLSSGLEWGTCHAALRCLCEYRETQGAQRYRDRREVLERGLYGWDRGRSGP